MELMIGFITVVYFMARVHKGHARFSIWDYITAGVVIILSLVCLMRGIDVQTQNEAMYKLESKVIDSPNPIGVKYNGDINDGKYYFSNSAGFIRNSGIGLKAE